MYVGYFMGSFFTAYSVVQHSPSPLYTLNKANLCKICVMSTPWGYPSLFSELEHWTDIFLVVVPYFTQSL